MYAWTLEWQCITLHYSWRQKYKEGNKCCTKLFAVLLITEQKFFWMKGNSNNMRHSKEEGGSNSVTKCHKGKGAKTRLHKCHIIFKIDFKLKRTTVPVTNNLGERLPYSLGLPRLPRLFSDDHISNVHISDGHFFDRHISDRHISDKVKKVHYFGQAWKNTIFPTG